MNTAQKRRLAVIKIANSIQKVRAVLDEFTEEKDRKKFIQKGNIEELKNLLNVWIIAFYMPNNLLKNEKNLNIIWSNIFSFVKAAIYSDEKNFFDEMIQSVLQNKVRIVQRVRREAITKQFEFREISAKKLETRKEGGGAP